jgi:uncharacterized protein YgbK (DUF1537 family)
MKPNWLIIADDLTGAADCAIAFAKRGRESVVTWNKQEYAGSVPVLSVDTATRRLSPEQAAKRQTEVLAAHFHPGLRLYKKIDSTVRGQPAAELAALLAFSKSHGNCRQRLGIVAPAFPATGRATVNGSIIMGGLPLEQTPLWARDHTYTSASLPKILAAAGLGVEVITLDILAGGADGVRARLRDAQQQGLAAVVCDAKTESDLRTLAAASLEMGDEVIWVGSAGLAAALAWEENPGASPARLPLPTRGRKSILIVVGTLAEASRLQAKTLIESHLVQHVMISPEALFSGQCNPEWQQAKNQLAQALRAEKDTLLELKLSADPNLGRGAELAGRLAELVTDAREGFGAIVATGGDTIYALLTQLGVHSVRLLDEVEPGVPLGFTVGAIAIPVVTKAGAFGDALSLRRAVERLQKL